jgi:hypothetical protein
MGGIFLFSGYTKIGLAYYCSSPIEPFEYTFVDLGFINWKVAPFIARIMIGVEFLIGILLILNVNLKKLTYKIGIGILVLFCIYLLLQIFLSGNKGNCGCFGSCIIMTPLQALIKNFIMLAVFFILYKYHTGWELKNKWKYLLILPFVFSLVMPFILNPVALDYSEAYLNKPENNFKLELDSLYNNATLSIPPKTLSKGKHVIAFMSLTCPHCRIAAKKIRILHERNPEISFYFVLNGDNEKLKPFFEDTKTEAMPHCILNGRNFVYLAGANLPCIYLINNSTVENSVNYIDLDEQELKNWLKK